MSTLALLLLAGMLITYVVLDGYDLGIGSILYFFARSDEKRGRAIASIGPYWNGNEVWLIAAGGVLFALFPRAYAVALSGFYLPFMLILWLLIGRGIALELRGHYANQLWHDFWDLTFCLTSAALVLLLGVALGNLLRGVPLDGNGTFVGSFGLLLNPYALLVGFFSLVLLAQHGWCYLRMQLPQEAVPARVTQLLWWLALLLDCTVAVITLTMHPLTGRKLWVAGGFGFIALLALIMVGVYSARRLTLSAFLASSLVLATLLGAAVANVYPNLITSSNAQASLTIFACAPAGGAAIAILTIVALGLISVYSYLAVVLAKLAGK